MFFLSFRDFVLGYMDEIFILYSPIIDHIGYLQFILPETKTFKLEREELNFFDVILMKKQNILIHVQNQYSLCAILIIILSFLLESRYNNGFN